jgi:hypothetical protein
LPDFLSSVDTAERWNISVRRVALLCEQERIPGAFKIGANWTIPADAEKPPDARIKSGKYIGFKEKYKQKQTADKEKNHGRD